MQASAEIHTAATVKVVVFIITWIFFFLIHEGFLFLLWQKLFEMSL